MNGNEPSTSEELFNAGRRVTNTVGEAANLARGINNFSKQRKENKLEKELKNTDKKDNQGKVKNKSISDNKNENKENNPISSKKEKGSSLGQGMPKVNVNNPTTSLAQNKGIKGSTKQGAELAKKGGELVAKGAKAAGNGLKTLWKLIPPPYNWIALGVILLIILLLFIIMLVASQEQEGKIYYRCTNVTVPVADSSGNITTQEIPLEDYVAGVCSHESSSLVTQNSDGTYTIEALKAQAVAARTYTLDITKDCTIAAPASNSGVLGYKSDYDANAVQAALETEGEILVYNEKYFYSEWDAFYGNRCEGGYCYATYTKEPNNETHEIKVKESLLPNYAKSYFGHGRGLSQYGAYSMEKEGYSYDNILYEFYSDGVEIVKNGEGTAVNDVLEYAYSYDFQGNYTTQWASETERLEGTNLSSLLGSSGIDELNSYITEQIDSVETYGEKVASAGMALAVYLHEQGYRLPYYWGGGHSSISNGVNQYWGGSISASCSPARCYYYNGLDCSGFVIWALQNVGCGTNIFSFSSFISANSKRSSLSDLKAGDLLMSTGHVILVIGYSEDLGRVLTVESAGGAVGMVFRAYAAANLGGYYYINMDNFYNTKCG